jgi:hypothetical protein
MLQKNLDFFTWFCHWGIIDETEQDGRIDDVYNNLKTRHKKLGEK